MSLKDLLGHTEDQQYPIWFLDNTKHSVRLYKIDEINYFIIENGDLTPIISNPLFVLINQELLNFFLTYTQTDLKPKMVSIFDRPSNTYIDGYYSIAANTITFESIATLEHEGNQMWIDSNVGAIFISLSLKKDLEKVRLQGLDCYPGYSMFGA